MEYAINQRVKYAHLGFTGKIIGHSGENFIILLDSPTSDGSSAVLTPADSVEPLDCTWCGDTQKITVPSFTMAQVEAGEIPEVDCPYCVE